LFFKGENSQYNGPLREKDVKFIFI